MNYRIYDKDKKNIQGSASFRYKHFEVSFGKMSQNGVLVKHLGGHKEGHVEKCKDMDEAIEYLNQDDFHEKLWDD